MFVRSSCFVFVRPSIQLNHSEGTGSCAPTGIKRPLLISSVATMMHRAQDEVRRREVTGRSHGWQAKRPQLL